MKKFLILLLILFNVISSYSNTSGFKKNRIVSICVSNDFKENNKEFNELRELVYIISTEKKINTNNIRLIRNDSKETKLFGLNEINYQDEFFNKIGTSNPTLGIEQFDILLNKTLQNFVESDYKEIFVYCSDLSLIGSFSSQRYKIATNINDFKSIFSSTLKKLKKKDNILVLQIFKKNIQLSLCENLKIGFKKNEALYRPTINLHSDIKLHGEKNSGVKGNSYLISWKHIAGFTRYEINLNNDDIRLFVEVNETNVGGQDQAYIENDTVYYLLSEEELGEKCFSKYQELNNHDCMTCKYQCIYDREWSLKIRGIACNEIYGPYSITINEIQLQCPKKQE